MNKGLGTAATTVTALLALAVCAGCERGPSQAERVAASNASQARLQAIADQIMGRIEDTARDLPLELDYVPDLDDREGVCDNDLPRAGEDPKYIQWITSRAYYIDPPQDTASRLDTIIEPLLNDGWALSEDSEADGRRSIDLYSDGYIVTIGGDSRIETGSVNSIAFTVYGPCIDAPASTP